MQNKKTGLACLALAQLCFLASCQELAVNREPLVTKDLTSKQVQDAKQEARIESAAERTGLYFPLLRGKRCAVTTNHTGVIGPAGLVDSLIRSGITVKKIFSPEHGYQGKVSDGESIDNTADPATGITVVSLYGSKKKPSPDDLRDIDLVIYDIQDVGVRCYTYISTLHYVMEACAESHVPLMVLDRPDPLGFYIDGPVLDTAFRSFVGMHPIPLVYGLTVGELALMINGEGWLGKGLRCDLNVIPCAHYTHRSRYQLPVDPSPNLQNMEAVYLYPSVALFEGTIMNVGRGTPFSYQVFGHPEYPDHEFSYTPRASSGNISPKHVGQLCYGSDLRNIPLDSLRNADRIDLSWLINAYKTMKRRDFFIPFIDKLAGTSALRKQIESGQTEEQIRESWKPQLEKYRQMRKKYLLYFD
jgi:uncharacterized protein YbbC (DUF1343 family)